MTNDSLQRLRDKLYDEPSEAGWRDVLALLDKFPEEIHEVAASYLAEHVSHWPASLRPMPRYWIDSWQEHLWCIPAAGHLEIDMLEHSPATLAGFAPAANLRGLGVLIIRNFNNVACGWIRELQLERLDIAQVTGQPSCASELSRNRQLGQVRRLHLDLERVDNVANCFVDDMWRLSELTVHGGYLTIAGVGKLVPRLANLVEVELIQTQVSATALSLLLDAEPCSALRRLTFEQTVQANPAAVLGSRDLGSLSHLSLRRLVIEDSDLAALLGRLGTDSSLEELEIRRCRLTDDVIPTLSAWTPPPSLQVLDLRDNRMSETGLRRITRAPKLAGIETIHTDGNSPCDPRPSVVTAGPLRPRPGSSAQRRTESRTLPIKEKEPPTLWQRLFEKLRIE